MQHVRAFADRLKRELDMDITAIYLFGSLASSSDFRSHSDIDLALFSPKFEAYDPRIYIRLFDLAEESGVPNEWVIRLSFRLYSDKYLSEPTNFVKFEILEDGIRLV